MKVKHAVKHRRLQGELWLPTCLRKQTSDDHIQIVPCTAFVYHANRQQEGRERRSEQRLERRSERSSVQEATSIPEPDQGQETSRPGLLLTQSPHKVASKSRRRR